MAKRPMMRRDAVSPFRDKLWDLFQEQAKGMAPTSSQPRDQRASGAEHRADQHCSRVFAAEQSRFYEQAR